MFYNDEKRLKNVQISSFSSFFETVKTADLDPEGGTPPPLGGGPGAFFIERIPGPGPPGKKTPKHPLLGSKSTPPGGSRF